MKTATKIMNRASKIALDGLMAAAVDYDPRAKIARPGAFFRFTQNLLHYAVTQQTAAQLVLSRCSRTKPNAGLHSFSGIRPTLGEAKRGVNYLSPIELEKQRLLHEQVLLAAHLWLMEDQPFKMIEIVERVRTFIAANDLPVGFWMTDDVERAKADAHAAAQLGYAA